MITSIGSGSWNVNAKAFHPIGTVQMRNGNVVHTLNKPQAERKHWRPMLSKILETQAKGQFAPRLGLGLDTTTIQEAPLSPIAGGYSPTADLSPTQLSSPIASAFVPLGTGSLGNMRPSTPRPLGQGGMFGSGPIQFGSGTFEVGPPVGSGSLPLLGTGQLLGSGSFPIGPNGIGTGPLPSAAPGPTPRIATGPIVPGPPGSGPPRIGTGPITPGPPGAAPRIATGPIQPGSLRVPMGTGPIMAGAPGTPMQGPGRRIGTGPIMPGGGVPNIGTGPIQFGTGPITPGPPGAPRIGTGTIV